MAGRRNRGGGQGDPGSVAARQRNSIVNSYCWTAPTTFGGCRNVVILLQICHPGKICQPWARCLRARISKGPHPTRRRSRRRRLTTGAPLSKTFTTEADGIPRSATGPGRVQSRSRPARNRLKGRTQSFHSNAVSQSRAQSSLDSRRRAARVTHKSNVTEARLAPLAGYWRQPNANRTHSSHAGQLNLSRLSGTDLLLDGKRDGPPRMYRRAVFFLASAWVPEGCFTLEPLPGVASPLCDDGGDGDDDGASGPELRALRPGRRALRPAPERLFALARG
jgi:hypothetical protein